MKERTNFYKKREFFLLKKKKYQSLRAENGRVNVKEVRAFGVWHLLVSFFIHQKPLSFVLTLFV